MIEGSILVMIGTMLAYFADVPLALVLCFIVPGIVMMKEKVDKLKDTMRMQEQKVRYKRDAEMRRLEKAYLEEPERKIAYKEGAVMAYNETLAILRKGKEDGR